ncbi:MAG: VCBS repeat-containing protein [Putridiphycobacter sp.]
MKITKLSAILSMVYLLSCQSNSNENKSETKEVSEQMYFTTLTPAETGISFSNNLTETDELNYFTYEYMYNGGGVAVGDINNDGLTDIYFTGNQVSDKLYLNKGDMKFEDITSSAIGDKASEGWHTGVSMVDINQDGWLDIYVCRSGLQEDKDLLGNLLFINNKNNTFSEKATEFGVDVKRKTTQSVFFDFDNDNDLDLYVMNHPNQNKDGKTMSVGAVNDLIKKGSPDSDVLLENVDGSFVDITKKAGMSNHAYGLGVTASDINGDGFIDLYVSNDYMAPDHLYINNGDGTFTDEVQKQMKHISNYAMGNDVADFNNDGFLDVFVLDMVSEDHIRSKKNMGGMSTDKFWQAVSVGYHYQYMFNTLQMNNGNGSFSEIAQLSGVSKTDWSWTPLFVDFDNDGLKDLIVTNGYRRDTRDNDYVRQSKNPLNKNKSVDEQLELIPTTKVLNYIYKNNGSLHFDKKMDDWKLTTPVNSNGAAYADFDNDGDVDLVINNMEDVSSVLRNDLSSNNRFIRLKLIKNKSIALGTKVKLITDNGDVQYQELQTTRGYQSSVEPILHFGVSSAQKIEKIEIVWTDNSITVIEQPEVNKLIEVTYESSKKRPNTQVKTNDNMFEDKSELVDFKHQEFFVNDFETEVLLPNKMSQLGPFMSKGDINGDGLEDFYLSGSRGFSGKMFVQQSSGEFKLVSGPWETQKQREEMGSAFFDIDGDGDLDLYVLSGGNEYDIRSKNLYDQLYLNDGNGQFSNQSDQLPFMETSGQRLTVGDYDNDGDIDVFIGGRQTPGFYPFAPRSFLLENQGGKLIDVTVNSKDLMGPGLITESVFEDFDQDGDLDLICVGEWMPISFFENQKGIFTNVTKKYGTENEVGWWQSITVGDYNNDGKNDYIIGNQGWNNKFHPAKDHPLEIYCHDFDESGTYDIVLGKYQNNVCYPVRGKQCSTEQMPFVSQKFPTYGEFAVADLEKIYGKENLEKALHYSATTFSSVILLSQGDSYAIKELPVYAQISPINAGVSIDVNQDGNLDFVGVGNNYGAEVETVRYDAGVGVVLLGDGKGNFTNVRPAESGFFTNGDAKDMLLFNKMILVSSNNANLKLFKLR